MGRYGTTRRHIAEGAIAPRKLHDSLRQGLYGYEKFNDQPLLTGPLGYGPPTGVTGDQNLARFRGGLQSRYHVKGTQTLLGPAVAVGSGVDVSQDQTAADGVEHVFGGALGIPNPFRYVTGTTKPVEARLKLNIPDVSGAAECAFGLREVDAFTANFDDYTDLAALNVQAGVVNLETILNNAATVTTNTLKTWVDLATKELKVRIVGRVPRFFVDGQEVITASTPYTFQNGIALVPFFFFLQAADLTPIYWDEFEWAYVEDIDDTKVSN